MDPIRYWTSEANDIGRQQCIILQVIGGVVADDIDDRCRGAAGVVRLARPFARPGPMQKCHSGFACNAAITISSTSCYTFKKTKYRPQPLNGVEGCNQMHFRGTGVAKTDIDTAIDHV